MLVLPAGAIATCINTPLDVAKTRIQSELPTPAAVPANTSVAGRQVYTYTYRHLLQTLPLIARTEGVKALYRGFVPKVLRMSLGGAVCITAYDHAVSVIGGTHY